MTWKEVVFVLGLNLINLLAIIVTMAFIVGVIGGVGWIYYQLFLAVFN